ncbi:hypothetical protein GY45DRAFT_673313 [Cubamyces sp. BRFM 1775]|nr:hypothetical protein GY45DRAFT_673313 [Cubamyces sp. BRFM 1775]
MMKTKKTRHAVTSGQVPSSPSPMGLIPSVALAHPLSTATRQQVSQHAMLTSITTGVFEDVKFYVFSRRTRSGRVDTPRPLFANNALLVKVSQDFAFVDGFAESKATDMAAPYPPERTSYTTEYTYSEDSDLEDDTADYESDLSEAFSEDNLPPPHLPKPCIPKPEPVPSAEPSSYVLSPDEPSYWSPGVPVAEPESHKTDHTPAGSEAAHSVAPVQTGCSKDTSIGEQQAKEIVTNCSRKGRVVFIEDFAYRTWEAFIFYAYFGSVSFAPLRSQKERRPKHELYEPPPCSAKSMYRLADKYGIQELKDIAMASILERMTAHTILVELFSPFTAVYPEIKGVELDYLVAHISDEQVLAQMPKWLRYLEEGRLPRGSASIISTLISQTSSRVGRRGW